VDLESCRRVTDDALAVLAAAPRLQRVVGLVNRTRTESASEDEYE